MRVVATTPIAVVPAPADTRPRRGLAVFAGLIACSAWGGAVGLALDALGLPPEIQDRLPFGSQLLGGVALALVVGVPMTVVAVLAWRGDPRTGPAAVIAGILQVAWIVVQVAFIRELSFFHPTYLLVGAALIAVGRRLPGAPAPGS